MNQQFFLSFFVVILNTGRKRLNLISKHYFLTGKPKKEQRGGSRVTESQLEVTASMVNFIKKLKVLGSHYGRRKSSKQYLSAVLNVKKLWQLWKAERGAAKLHIASLHKFGRAFLDRFNLSFVPPKVDVCSQCETLKSKIKLKIDEEENSANFFWIAVLPKIKVTMLGYLLRIMENPAIYKHVRDIQFFFPVRGHSYLPPDRVFGHIPWQEPKSDCVN